MKGKQIALKAITEARVMLLNLDCGQISCDECPLHGEIVCKGDTIDRILAEIGIIINSEEGEEFKKEVKL